MRTSPRSGSLADPLPLMSPAQPLAPSTPKAAIPPRNSRRVVTFTSPPVSTAAYERHLGGHDGHELHVGIERQVRHVQHRRPDVVHVHQRLGPDLAIRLSNAV